MVSIPPNLHFLFEVEDMAVASPATVSRLGFVHFEELPWNLQIKKLISKDAHYVKDKGEFALLEEALALALKFMAKRKIF